MTPKSPTSNCVDKIARVVYEAVRVEPTFGYTGGDRGWTGDVAKMRLCIQKLAALRWEPNYESTTAVRMAAEELVQEI